MSLSLTHFCAIFDRVNRTLTFVCCRCYDAIVLLLNKYCQAFLAKVMENYNFRMLKDQIQQGPTGKWIRSGV